MKIIFLDIDGVLNVIGQGHDEYGQTFHPHLVDNLKRIIDETGAKIVISSTWRHSGLTAMQEMWKHRGLPGEVIDVTPMMRNSDTNMIVFFNDRRSQDPLPRIYSYSIPRGCEIEYWMKNESFLNGREAITDYVILDDDTDMLLNQFKHFVQCSGNLDDEDCVDAGYGLTKKCADKAIQILNRKDPKYA